MALANVTLDQTYYVWVVRTNQLVNIINNLIEGQHNSIGTITLTNASGLTHAINVTNGSIRVGANTFYANGIGLISNTSQLVVSGTGRLGDKLFLTVTPSDSVFDNNASNIASANSVYTTYQALSTSISGIADITDALGVSVASAYNKANAANVLAFTSNATAVGAFTQANIANVLAYAVADTVINVNATVASAFTQANTANIHAISAFTQANNSNITAIAAFNQANTANAGLAGKANVSHTHSASEITGLSSGGTPRGYIDGLTTGNFSDNANNDIFIRIGVARSSNNNMDINLSSQIVKQLTNTWSLGSNAGGRFGESLANGDWNLFVVGNGNVSCAGFSQNSNPTSDMHYPSGFEYRRIATILRLANVNLQYSQNTNSPERFWLSNTVMDFDVTDSVSTRVIVTSNAPANTEAIIGFTGVSATGSGGAAPGTIIAKVGSNTEINRAPDTSICDIVFGQVVTSSSSPYSGTTYYWGGIPISQRFNIFVDNAKKYFYRKAGGNTVTFRGRLLGWFDRRKS